MRNFLRAALFLLLGIGGNMLWSQSVTVIDPNGGETLGGCTTYTIRWDAQNTSGYFSIDFSTDNAVNWTSVASGLYLPGNGTKSFSWSVPNVNSNLCRVRVVDTYASGVRDSSNAVFTITEAMRLLVPNGGEVWPGLSTQSVAWNNNSSSTTWRLEYSTNSGVSWLLINNSYSSPSGNYSWLVNHTPSTTCKFRVTATGNACVTDQTDGLFEISAVPPVLLTPNGGEQWWSLDPYYITWDQNSVLSSTVRLEYSTDNGTTWNVIIANTANSGSYYWTLPFAPSTQALVRLTETANTTRKDTSDVVFTIKNPVIVTTPNGGQNYNGCNSVTISGSKARNLSQVKVEYSSNNGSSWNLIGTTSSSTSNSWAISWTTPPVTSSQFLIRASNPSNAGMFDESDAPFTVTTNNELTLQTPNGGQVWTSLNTYAINWFTGPSVPSTMSISYSTDAGSSWNTITSSISTALGTYNWTPPNLSSTQCLIRIQSNSCHTDVSDAVFTINPVKPLLTTPNGGEQWYGTDPYYIYWDPQTLLSPTIRLEYSTNNGSNWNVVVGSLAGSSGGYYWTLPNAPSTTALVRLLELSDTTRKDTSNAVFTIRPVVTVNTPNGGQLYYGCNTVTISGNKARNLSQVKVEYTTNGGSTWNLIGTTSSSTSNSWAMSWVIPNLTSTQCRIRASNPSNGAIYDESDADFTINPTNELTVLSPNGGEVWTSLNTYQVQWQAGPAVPSTVSISYSTNGGSSWNTIISSTSTSTGFYNWSIPNLSSTQCLIRVQSGSCHVDQSDAVFTINPVKPLLTTPNGGEQWYATDPYYIYWDTQTLLYSTLRLEYSTNSGANWNVIIGSTASSSGGYYWTVPNTPSTTALVRLLELGDTTRKDTSNAVFTIRPMVNVNTPNGGQNYFGCNTVTVSGNKARNLSQVKVEYTTDGGSTWNLIGTTSSSTSNSWAISWSIPNLTSSQCRIRASHPSNSAIYDESDANFTINPTNELTVITPNGGEVWTSLNTYQIQWLAGPAVPSTLSISYSTDGGSSWNTIVSSTSTSTGFYNWSVPNLSSNQCLIRVQSGSCHVDQSNAVFTINPVKPLLTTPNGGEQWYATDPYYIYWDTQTLLYSTLRLEYSTNNGANWNVIIGSTASSSGGYYWTLPFAPSNQALVRLLEIGDTTRKDTSNAVFTIRNPVIINTPNGGQSYNGCNTVTISGNKARNVSQVKVEYSSNNGATWNLIGNTSSSTSNSWAISWTTPSVTSSQFLIRASNVSNPAMVDESDATFSVSTNNELTLQSPNGGQVWTSLNTYPINWFAGPSVPSTISISYSTDAGLSWNTIISSVSTALGTYNWTPPNLSSTQCLIRIQSNSCHTDVSNAVFTINPVKPLLTTPNGGEQWYATDPYYIYWDPQTLLSSTIRLEYSTNSGSNWNVVVGSVTGSSGGYYWTVPNTPSTTALVRLLELSDTTRKDTSNAVFTIRPTVIVNTPNGGQTYYGCNTVTISGNKARNLSQVKVEYTTNGGSTWNLIGTTSSSTSNSWALSWSIPNLTSTQCRIRASNPSNGTIYDESDANFTINPTNELTVVSPNGGEVWTSLNTYQIQWLAGPAVPSTLSISYSTNGGTSWNTITSSTSTATGFYNWTLPNLSSTQCLIRVQSGSCHVDESDAVFTINPVNPILTTPNGGETWYGGQTQYIYWNTSSLLGGTNVRLEYSTNNGASWNVIIGSYSGSSGGYPWVIPNLNTSQALVRLIEVSNPTRMDTSDAVFNIRPAITVVSPNGNTGNENFRGCTITSLTWNHSPSVTRFNLQYTTNNGSTWTTITSNYYAPGTSSTYNWTMPNTPTTQARVRVQDYYGAVPSDESDNLFNITQPVVLTQPTYGGVLQAGSVHNITWVSDGISNFYNLDYSTDGGSTWINIVTNYNTSTYVYAWTVPNTPSANCKVRVTDYLNSCKQDISDATFSINNLPPSITLLTPNGYDTTAACSTRMITWNATGTSGNYNLSYSTDAGVNWIPIVNNYPAPTNSYSWTYGNLNSNFVLVRVQDAADLNKVDQSDAAFALTPVALTVSGDTSVCAGVPVPLSVSGGTSYTWAPSTGLSNPNIANPSANPSSTTVYTVTSQVGSCTLSETVEVSVVSRPSIALGGPTTICQGDTLSLTSSELTGNAWSTGETTQAIEVTQSGSYAVTATTGSCVLTSDTVHVSVITPTTPTVTANGPLAFCEGGVVQLTSSLPTGIVWNTGSTATTISVDTSGTYYVSEANACGTASATVTVTVYPEPTTPTITASGPLNICIGDTVTLASSVPTGNVWSNGATTATIRVWQTGVYSVSQTNGFGCTVASVPVTVVVSSNSNPTVTALGTTTFCQGDSVVLTSNLSQNLIWSSGDTTPSILVKQAGTYQVFDQTGCGGVSNSVTVSVIPAPSIPVISASGSTQLCQGTQVTLSAPTATSYAWSNGSTTQSITTGIAGSYTVTVSNANGCEAVSSPVSVIVVTPTPASITPSGPTAFCQGGSVTLSASSGASFAWSNGATTQSISPNTSGSFVVTVTDVNGCVSVANAQSVVVNPLPASPIVLASGPLTFCAGDSVVLSSSYATGNQWSTGSTQANISVSNTATIQVTHTDANGCSATSAPISVSVSPAPATPTILASGPTSFCQGDSVVLSAPTSASYLWSNGATTQQVTVFNSGAYAVTVANGAGCEAASASTNITVNAIPNTPTILTSGPTTFCTGGSVTLTAPTAGAYLWSNGATTQSIVVGSSGNFTVTVSNGTCQAASAPMAVTVSSTPSTPSIVANGPTTFCQGDSVVLTAPLSTGYLWSNGATTQSITVSNAGAYTVTVSNSGGCSANSAPTTVTVNGLPSAPTVTASGPTTFCAGGSVTLSVPTASSYLWSNGATTQSISVTAAGTYQVTVTNSGGCEAISNIQTVTVNAAPSTPVVTASGPTTFCQGGSVTLTAPVASGYLWSNGATTASITATSSGNYSVTVTNGSGCDAASAVTTVTVQTAPIATITPAGPSVICQGGTVTLVASAGSNFLWSNGATTQSITTNASGSFTVTITDVNGCTATSNAQSVVVNALPAAPTVTASGPLSFCTGGSVSLTSSYASGNLWSPTNATTPSISVNTSGTYFVTYTDANGCESASSPVTVTVTSGASTPSVSANGPTTFCQGDSVVLTSSVASSYAWSNGATSQSITVANTGSFTVTITDAGGCDAASTPISVTVNPRPAQPTITAGGSLDICDGESVTLTSSSPVDNVWSPTASTSQSIQATTAGNYVVTVTNAFGCSAQSTPVTVNVLALPAVPVISQSGADLVSTSASSYQWYMNGAIIPGATSQTYSPAVTGSYTVVVTNANGCENTSAAFNYVFVGVAEAGSGDALQIFPNPNNGLFTIELELGSVTTADFKVITMEGQVVWQYRLEGHVGLFRKQVDLTTMARGVYLLQIRTDSGKEFVERIVTQ